MFMARVGTADDTPAGRANFDSATSTVPNPRAVAPLERLRTRSSSDRWKRMNEELRDTSRVGTASQSVPPEPVDQDFVLPPSQPQVFSPNIDQGADPALPRSEPRRVAAYQPPQPTPDRKYAAPIRDPRDLRKVTEILPFFDYEPDPEVAKDDPCLYRCPRPDGAPCKQYPAGQAPACPEELELSNEVYSGRTAPSTMVNWEASNLYHNPLYFEDAALERYGHTHCCAVQPFVSVGKFSLQLAGLPYQATLDPMCKRMYTLGWYRPGECAPKKCYQIPWSWEAAAVQAGATTGMVFFLP